jgi:putative Mn2+ efflux pump MntP
MKFGAIFVLALGVAMDATAVAATRGMLVPRIRAKHVLLVMLFFGGAQALMPAIGWFLGARVGPLVVAWDHWIAFALLSAIGGKMLWESMSPDHGPRTSSDAEDQFSLKLMAMLAIATSIDALAVGITLPILRAPVLTSLATIGVTTAVLSALGLFAGRRFGAMLGHKLNVLGGLVLIGLGVKILLEHTIFGA